MKHEVFAIKDIQSILSKHQNINKKQYKNHIKDKKEKNYDQSSKRKRTRAIIDFFWEHLSGLRRERTVERKVKLV